MFSQSNKKKPLNGWEPPENNHLHNILFSFFYNFQFENWPQKLGTPNTALWVIVGVERIGCVCDPWDQENKAVLAEPVPKDKTTLSRTPKLHISSPMMRGRK